MNAKKQLLPYISDHRILTNHCFGNNLKQKESYHKIQNNY